MPWVNRLGLTSLVWAALLMAASMTAAYAQNVSRLLAERQQIIDKFQACLAATAEHNRTRVAPGAAQGIFVPPLPCASYMQLWTVQIWQYDIAIARANGDARPACQIEYMAGCENYRD